MPADLIDTGLACSSGREELKEVRRGTNYNGFFLDVCRYGFWCVGTCDLPFCSWLAPFGGL
jgi:hypothetical protein